MSGILKRAMANAVTPDEIEAKRKAEEAHRAVMLVEERSEAERCLGLERDRKIEQDSEAERLEESRSSFSRIGRMIVGKGVFLGKWEPKGRDGKLLGLEFNIYAAPEDLMDASGERIRLTFNEAATLVSSFRSWHGHDGIVIENDMALYNAITNGTYNGEWFIPTRDLLHGSDLEWNRVHYQDLFTNRYARDLKGTFMTNINDDHDGHWYWSCTECQDDPLKIWAVRLTDGDGNWGKRAYHLLSCRPVRVEKLVV